MTSNTCFAVTETKRGEAEETEEERSWEAERRDVKHTTFNVAQAKIPVY